VFFEKWARGHAGAGRQVVGKTAVMLGRCGVGAGDRSNGFCADVEVMGGVDVVVVVAE